MIINVKLVNRNINSFDELLLSFGLERKEITIIDGQIEIPEKGIVYIYGNSGSGKSYTLKKISEKLNTKVKKINISKYDNIDLLLKDYIQDLKTLAQFGFSDVPVLLTKVKHLSDGQKYRLFLLEEITKNDVLIFDEFCNPLDEFYTISILKTLTKFKNDKLIIVATSRPFGYQYFEFDKVYWIRRGDIIEIKYKAQDLTNDFEIEQATKKDWEYFSRFHYRNKSCSLFNKALKVKFKNEYIGIVIAGLPYLNISIRNKIFPKYKNNFKLVNKEIFTIHRIVVIPEMRNLGVARFLLYKIEEIYKNKGKKMSELLTSLSVIIPFTEKAGYIYGGDLPDNPVRKVCKKLNFDFSRYLDDDYVMSFIKKYRQMLERAVIKSYGRGITNKRKTLSDEQILRGIQKTCNVKSKYYYKLLS